MKYCFPGLLLLLIFVTPVLNSRGMKKITLCYYYYYYYYDVIKWVGQ